MQLIAPLPPKFEPGARYCYSNSGYVLLGLALEAASGRAYRRFVQEKIIEPCALQRTGFCRTDSLPANAAQGYMLDEETGEWRSNIYTCASDLDKIWRAIFDKSTTPP